MNILKTILGLIPFALFALLANFMLVGWAALISTAAALIFTLIDLRGGIKLIPAAGVVILGIFTILGFAMDAELQAVLGDYGRGLATLVLAFVILATVPIAPFTYAYAKATAPESEWHSEKFISTNRSISLAWGLAVLVMAVGHLTASAIDSTGATMPIINAALNWGLPIAAIVKTVNYTRRTVGIDPHPVAR